MPTILVLVENHRVNLKLRSDAEKVEVIIKCVKQDTVRNVQLQKKFSEELCHLEQAKTVNDEVSWIELQHDEILTAEESTVVRVVFSNVSTCMICLY